MVKENTSPPQRTFFIGSNWLYYKFYTGPKTADVVLTELVKPVGEKFIKQQKLDHWFFIRYADPQKHLRVRYHPTKHQPSSCCVLYDCW